MDMTRVSACSYPLRERPWQEALDVIAAAGFRKVDLLGRHPHLSLDPKECDPAAVKAAAQARGLRIANLGTYPGTGFASKDPAVQEKELAQVQRAIDIAAFLGARSIRVSVGDDDPQSLDRVVPWFQRSAAYAAQKKVYMGFETHGGGISGQPKLCTEVSRQVGSPFFGVLYDPCNVLTAGADYRAALQTMKDHIVHVHLKDAAMVDGKPQTTMLGEGQIDFAWVIRQLDAIGYAGDLALEYELEAPTPEVGLPRWLEAARAI